MDADVFAEDSIGWSVSAAMARQYAEDERVFFRELAETLQIAFPDETTVHRNGLFGGDKRSIRDVEILFPGETSGTAIRYLISDTGHGSLTAAKVQIVRGIVLKTAALPVPEWIEEVGTMISHRAERSKATRDALGKLL